MFFGKGKQMGNEYIGLSWNHSSGFPVRKRISV